MYVLATGPINNLSMALEVSQSLCLELMDMPSFLDTSMRLFPCQSQGFHG